MSIRRSARQVSIEERRLTWWRAGLIVLAIMAVTTLLVWWEPLWLRPPNFAQTDFVYAIIALLWIPAIVIVALRHPRGSRWIPVLLVLLGMFPLLLGVGLFIRGSIIESSPPNCNQKPVDAGQVLYTCRVSLISDSAADYVFEGPENFPLVRPISLTICESSGCK